MNDISDHSSTFIVVPKAKQGEEIPRKQERNVFSFKNYDAAKAEEDLSRIDWTPVYEQPDAETAYNVFTNILQIILICNVLCSQL